MNNKTNVNNKLGKGMAALLGSSSSISNDYIESITKTNKSIVENTPLLIDIDSIIPNKDQPRKIFRETELNELSNSIKENGIIQPLIVSESEEAGKFNLIAGERRLRASKIAGLERVPVVVKRATKKETLVMAIVENVQRDDLNCVEEALAYYQLMEEFQLTQEEVSKKIGKDRSTIANFLRILRLPREVVSYLQKNKLSFGHGKVLASVKENEKIKRLADLAIQNEWSVRELERALKTNFDKTVKEPVVNKFLNEKLDFAKQKLENKTGFNFNVKSKSNGNGSITINFNNEAEFNDVFDYLMK